MKTSDIKYFLELNQVGLVQNEPQLWAHSDPVSRSKSSFVNDKVLCKQSNNIQQLLKCSFLSVTSISSLQSLLLLYSSYNKLCRTRNALYAYPSPFFSHKTLFRMKRYINFFISLCSSLGTFYSLHIMYHVISLDCSEI